MLFYIFREIKNMELLKNTFYINLESRTDRLEHIHRELDKMNIKGERFNAIKTKVGSIGCTLSHIKCLELALERDYDEVFICEDDITFLYPETFQQSLQTFYEDTELVWDVLIISGNNVPPYEKRGEHCIRVSNCQTTTGYVVKKHYYKVLIQNFRESVQNLIREPKNHKEYAVDMFWKRLQRKDKWYLITPITVVQYDSYSDIEQRNVDYRELMLDIDKAWLFR
jgi:GR25 family glycosyltransferase involved in LPS biosynthesis